MLERFAHPREVEQVAEKLLSALRRPFSAKGYDLVVGGTIGIAIASPDLRTPKDLLRAADVALYRAKAAGGGVFAVFDPSVDRQGLERLEQEADLRRALERGEFHIAYQPIVDIASRSILAVEALLRWDHPERGLLHPSEFIPLADETGLIVPLGRWVIEEACRQVSHWQDIYPAARSLQVSVNLSARQFRQDDLENDVAEALGKSGLAPERLALELKEGDALANSADVAATLDELKRLGVKVTIDDFGKGWAALGSLTRFRVDDLKIDGSCVSRIGQDQHHVDIVRALVGMAKAIGLDVTAGAVETGEQLAVLRELGCDRAQGRHLAPPLTVEELERLLHVQEESEPGITQLDRGTSRSCPHLAGAALLPGQRPRICSATYQGLILVYIAYSLPFTIFFLTAFFKTLPAEVGEAAILDGASQYQIFFQIMLPLAKPGLIAMGIFNFLGQWNQFLLPLVLMPNEDTVPPLAGPLLPRGAAGLPERLRRPLRRDGDHHGADPDRLHPLPAPPRIGTHRGRAQGVMSDEGDRVHRVSGCRGLACRFPCHPDTTSEASRPPTPDTRHPWHADSPQGVMRH